MTRGDMDMTDEPITASAARRWPTLFMVGFVVLLGACFMSRYAQPDWTGAVVALLVVVGAITVFCAGLFAANDGDSDA